MWNNNQGPPNPGFPSAPGFPLPAPGFPSQQPYNPSYAPPPSQFPQPPYAQFPGAAPSPGSFPTPQQPSFPQAPPQFGAPQPNFPGGPSPYAPSYAPSPYGPGAPQYAPSYTPPTGPSPYGPGIPQYAPPPPPGQRGQFQAPGVAHMPPTQQQHYGPPLQNANHNQVQPFFQYSQCTGKKRALLIGINYIGLTGELKGCINDVKNVQRFLCTHFGYRQQDMVLLTDDSHVPSHRPTRANILSAMQWLVSGAQPNDSLFFHYSGHGGQTKDLDKDEADGRDEVIYPVDHEQNGHITDDYMHSIMVRPLPPGCRLTAIYDSCHSGSALDLPYVYSTEGKIKEPNLYAEAGQGLLSAVTSGARGDYTTTLQSVAGLLRIATGSAKKAEEHSRATRTSPADVISWSGCKDAQTSADAHEQGEATGAMSYAFVRALSQNKQQTYRQLLNNIRDILRSKYSQKPQLSSSHPIDTDIIFIC